MIGWPLTSDEWAAWPPPPLTTWEFSSLSVLLASLDDYTKPPGYSIRNPTQGERTQFNAARCEQGHTVNGRVLTGPAGKYPFGRCDDAQHRQLLVPWPPFSLDTGSN